MQKIINETTSLIWSIDSSKIHNVHLSSKLYVYMYEETGKKAAEMNQHRKTGMSEEIVGGTVANHFFEDDDDLGDNCFQIWHLGR